MSFEFTQKKLAEQKLHSRYRQRVCTQQANINKLQSSTKIIVDGKPYINFSSNDYLGLNNHPEINRAMQEGIDKFGLCASSSNLVTGFNYAHQALEETVCEWLNKPKCLLFSSGFAANVALFQTLGQSANQEKCHFFLDKLSHASMIDGAFSSNAHVKRFAHNNMSQLSRLLSNNKVMSKFNNTLIASEGVFSMDGDQAKLAELEQLAQQHNAWLYLDDAHSIGVIGEEGKGSTSFLNTLPATRKQPTIIMATLGKAIATSGAFLACDEVLHDYLINFARHYIYSTAISPAIAWATIQSIKLIQREQWRREKVIELSHLLMSKLDGRIKLIPSDSAIHAIMMTDETMSDEKKALQVSEELKKQGIWLTAIRPPTVPTGLSRLRVTICANHNVNNINRLYKSLHRVIK